MFAFAFPPFSLIAWVINKVLQKSVETMILVTPTWQTQPWYTPLLRRFIQCTLLLPTITNLLLNRQGEKHPLVNTTCLRFVAWKITRKPWKQKGFQAMQPKLSPCAGNQIQLQVTNLPEIIGLAGVAGNKLIQFACL